MALSSRFCRTLAILSSAIGIGARSGGAPLPRRTPFSSARSDAPSIALPTTSPIETGERSSGAELLSSLASSTRSSVRLASWPTTRRQRRTYSAGSSTTPSAMASSMARSEVSGVRKSCEAPAMKSLLAASSRADSRSASSSFSAIRLKARPKSATSSLPPIITRVAKLPSLSRRAPRSSCLSRSVIELDKKYPNETATLLPNSRSMAASVRSCLLMNISLAASRTMTSPTSAASRCPTVSDWVRLEARRHQPSRCEPKPSSEAPRPVAPKISASSSTS